MPARSALLMFRWMRGQLPFVVTVALILAGLIAVAAMRGHWRPGTAIVGAALLAAGVLRATLPRRRAGMLVVRARWWDTVCYLVMGGVIVALDVRLH